MTTKKLGGQTVALACPPSLLSFANVVGKKEGRDLWPPASTIST